MATLKLVPVSGSPIFVESEQAVVGRDPTCDVVVNDGSVSRKHARLEQRGGGWAVVDQGSANGTFLDSQRVAETMLRDGQELRFGAVAFQVEIEEDEVGATILTPMPAVSDATVMQPAVIPPRPPAPPPLPSRGPAFPARSTAALRAPAAPTRAAPPGWGRRASTAPARRPAPACPAGRRRSRVPRCPPRLRPRSGARCSGRGSDAAGACSSSSWASAACSAARST